MLHIELCCECDQPTGNAGRLDDSLYTDDGKGPYCHDCFEVEKKKGVPVSKIIYFAESESEEAVLVADDWDDALLLLGAIRECSCHLSAPCSWCIARAAWRLDKIGHANIGQPSEVLSRVKKV
jgi:hypothetical protein